MKILEAMLPWDLDNFFKGCQLRRHNSQLCCTRNLTSCNTWVEQIDDVYFQRSVSKAKRRTITLRITNTTVRREKTPWFKQKKPGPISPLFFLFSLCTIAVSHKILTLLVACLHKIGWLHTVHHSVIVFEFVPISQLCPVSIQVKDTCKCRTWCRS